MNKVITAKGEYVNSNEFVKLLDENSDQLKEATVELSGKFMKETVLLQLSKCRNLETLVLASCGMNPVPEGNMELDRNGTKWESLKSLILLLNANDETGDQHVAHLLQAFRGCQSLVYFSLDYTVDFEQRYSFATICNQLSQTLNMTSRPYSFHLHVNVAHDDLDADHVEQLLQCVKTNNVLRSFTFKNDLKLGKDGHMSRVLTNFLKTARMKTLEFAVHREDFDEDPCVQLAKCFNASSACKKLDIWQPDTNGYFDFVKVILERAPKIESISFTHFPVEENTPHIDWNACPDSVLRAVENHHCIKYLIMVRPDEYIHEPANEEVKYYLTRNEYDATFEGKSSQKMMDTLSELGKVRLNEDERSKSKLTLIYNTLRGNPTLFTSKLVSKQSVGPRRKRARFA